MAKAPPATLFIKSEIDPDQVWVRQYSGGVRPEWFGDIGLSLEQDTAALQAAFNIGGAVRLSKKTYMFEPGIDRGLISNNQIIGVGKETIIKLGFSKPPSTNTIQQVLRPKNYQNVENLLIADICIDGNMTQIDWSGVKGDGNAFGIGLWGTQNVTIRDVLVRNCWTDGIYIAYSHSTRPNRRNSSDIQFAGNIQIEDCGRQGMSIISAESLYCPAISIKGILRTSPKAAIDIEPNNRAPDKVADIYFGEIKSENTGAGFIIAGVSAPESIHIDRLICKDVRSTYGLAIGSARDVFIGHVVLEKTGGGNYPVVRISDYQNIYIGHCDTIVRESAKPGVLWSFEVDGTRFHHKNKDLQVDILNLNGSQAGGLRTEANTSSSFGSVTTSNINRADYALGHAAILDGRVFIQSFETKDQSHRKALDILSSSVSIKHAKLRSGKSGLNIDFNNHRPQLNQIELDNSSFSY
ncbi:hypothetical protein GCM10009096_16120 [Parasphingorhabdus litoris]|uniref:Right-handed parallel beta-helix repeat-containing protein n=2 Tax=Parasphingorhabdus litoris TaxID=394733 RepID=A0ABP3KAZ5_9SPHN